VTLQQLQKFPLERLYPLRSLPDLSQSSTLETIGVLDFVRRGLDVSVWEITTKLEILREFVENTDSLQKCVTTAKTLKALKEILFREPSQEYATEYEAEVYNFQVLIQYLLISSSERTK
jgi:hypothetical protein